MTIVTGVSDHYASAELVTLSAAEGGPIILDRRRVQSIDPELPAAPYHHEGLAVPIEKAEPIILRARHSVLAHARSALTELADALGVEAVVIQESPYEALPESVAEILASRPLACAADGMLYREALASQARAIGLTVHRFPRKSDQVRRRRPGSRVDAREGGDAPRGLRQDGRGALAEGAPAGRGGGTPRAGRQRRDRGLVGGPAIVAGVRARRSVA